MLNMLSQLKAKRSYNDVIVFRVSCDVSVCRWSRWDRISLLPASSLCTAWAWRRYSSAFVRIHRTRATCYALESYSNFTSSHTIFRLQCKTAKWTTERQRNRSTWARTCWRYWARRTRKKSLTRRKSRQRRRAPQPQRAETGGDECDARGEGDGNISDDTLCYECVIMTWCAAKLWCKAQVRTHSYATLRWVIPDATCTCRRTCTHIVLAFWQSWRLRCTLLWIYICEYHVKF